VGLGCQRRSTRRGSDKSLCYSVSEATEDVILGDAVFTNNDTVDGEQVDERSAVGTDNSDLGDEYIEPSHAEALCNITNSVGTENYSMLTTVSMARSEPLLIPLMCEFSYANSKVEQF
jgi:hypothetical protein